MIAPRCDLGSHARDSGAASARESRAASISGDPSRIRSLSPTLCPTERQPHFALSGDASTIRSLTPTLSPREREPHFSPGAFSEVA